MKRWLVLAILLSVALVGCGAEEPFLWRTPIPDGGSVMTVTSDGDGAWVNVRPPLGIDGGEPQVWRVDDTGAELVFEGGWFVAETTDGLLLASPDRIALMHLARGETSPEEVFIDDLVHVFEGASSGDAVVLQVGILEEAGDNLSGSYELWGIDRVNGEVAWKEPGFWGDDVVASVGRGLVALTYHSDGFSSRVELLDPASVERRSVGDPDTWKSGVSGVGGCVLGYREQLEPGADYLYVVEDICEGGRQEFAWGVAGWTGLGGRWLVGDGDELIAIDVGGPGATSYLVRVPLEGLNG